MIGIVAAMGGEVESDGHALLTGGEVAPVEGVGILGRGEAGILAHCPRPLHIHGGVGAAQVGRYTGQAVEEVETGEIVLPIDGLDRDAFRRRPGGSVRSGRGYPRLLKVDLGEFRNPGHSIPQMLISAAQCLKRIAAGRHEALDACVP